MLIWDSGYPILELLSWILYAELQLWRILFAAYIITLTHSGILTLHAYHSAETFIFHSWGRRKMILNILFYLFSSPWWILIQWGGLQQRISWDTLLLRRSARSWRRSRNTAVPSYPTSKRASGLSCHLLAVPKFCISIEMTLGFLPVMANMPAPIWCCIDTFETKRWSDLNDWNLSTACKLWLRHLFRLPSFGCCYLTHPIFAMAVLGFCAGRIDPVLFLEYSCSYMHTWLILILFLPSNLGRLAD